MLFRPTQSPIPQHQQQRIPITAPRINFNNRESNLRVQSPPPPRFIHQSPPPTSRATSDYMMHLIPQPNPNQNSQNVNHCSIFQHPHNSSVLTQVANRKYQSSNQTSMTNQKPVQMIMMNSPNLSTTDARSRGISDLSNKRSTMIMAHQNAYLSPPPPPLDLRKLEPVRRTSQYKVNVQQMSQVRSNRSQSQQNIKIIIQTSIPKASEIKPPTVSVSQVNSAPSQLNSPQIFNGPAFSRVMIAPPRSVHFQQSQRVTTSQDTKFRNVEILNNQIQNHGALPGMVTPIYRTVIERPHSYSMDTKNMVSNGQQHIHRVQVKNIITNPLVVHPPSQVFIDKKPVSFSAQPFSQVAQAKLSQQQKLLQETKKSFQSQKVKSQHKLSIQSHKKRKQQVRKLQRQIYNDYYDEQELDSSLTEEQHYRKRGNIYTMQQDKIMFNTRLLINQMYQNQVNKALLRMRSIDGLVVREKSVKKWYL